MFSVAHGNHLYRNKIKFDFRVSKQNSRISQRLEIEF